MISPAGAKAFILCSAVTPIVQSAALAECFGAVLAEDVTAPFPMPLADNSAMDGFVVRSRDTLCAGAGSWIVLKIAGTIKAGDSKRICVSSGKTFRIMTGAFIPDGADAVIPKEDAVIKEDRLLVNRPISEGEHIRRRGEEVRKGETLLRKGALLNPAAIGILASFGCARIRVYRKPKVSVLATGSELVNPGKKLSLGKIYDSNSWMIRAALSQMGVEPFRVVTLPDDLNEVRRAVRMLLRRSDYLVLLGGVSVGDYDVVKDALRREKVKTIFWKVNQKPGKPLYFGRKGRKIIFGLPGNPAATFTCFYEYVYPALQQTLGYASPGLEQKMLRVKGNVPAGSRRHLFLKAKISNGKSARVPAAHILSHQGSHMLSSLAEADGFLRVPAGTGRRSFGRRFQMDLLPR